jgi:hypothetical protein
MRHWAHSLRSLGNPVATLEIAAPLPRLESAKALEALLRPDDPATVGRLPQTRMRWESEYPSSRRGST